MTTQTCNLLPIGTASSACKVNVGENERWMSLLGGGLLAAHGLTRGSLVGLGLAAVGVALFMRGQTGHCQMYEALHYNTAK